MSTFVCLCVSVCAADFVLDARGGEIDTVSITVLRAKTQRHQVFHIQGSQHVARFLRIKRETQKMRQRQGSNRFFWQRREIKNGKVGTGCFRWHAQVIGTSWFGSYTKRLAKEIGIKEWRCYTSHSVRRTGASMMANGGCSIPQLKCYGGWDSDKVAQRYVDRSALTKRTLASILKSGCEESRRSSVACDDFEPRSPSYTPTKCENYKYVCKNNKSVSVSVGSLFNDKKSASASVGSLCKNKSECESNFDCDSDRDRDRDRDRERVRDRDCERVRERACENDRVCERASDNSEPPAKRRRLSFQGAVFNNCTFTMA